MANLNAEDFERVPYGTVLTNENLDPFVNFKTNADGTVTATPHNRLYWLNAKGLRKNKGVQTAIPYRVYTETYVKGAKIEEFYARRNGLSPELKKRIKLKRGKYGYRYEITCKNQEELASTLNELDNVYNNLIYHIDYKTNYIGFTDVNYPNSPPVYEVLKTKTPKYIHYANRSLVRNSVNFVDYSKSTEVLKQWLDEYIGASDTNTYSSETWHNTMKNMPSIMPVGNAKGYLVITEDELFPANTDWSKLVNTPGYITRPMIKIS
jgi:hypothetical protein